MATLNSFRSLIAGAIYGAALLASGISSPEVVKSQMSLKSTHLVQSFLAATASSAFIMYTADKAGIAKAAPRANSTLNWFSAYDANILGGLLQGIGMTLTGAGPETALVQIATGSRSALFVSVAGLAGAMVYVSAAPALVRSLPATEALPLVKHTLGERLSIPYSTLLLSYELLCFIALYSLAFLPHQPYRLHPIVGGLLIGLGQLASVLLMKKAIGVSGAYADVARYLGSILDVNQHVQLITPAVLFAVGVFVGAGLLAALAPTVTGDNIAAISRVRAVIGGGTLIFGARVAGGCSSGHGISGVSMFSMSSITTVAWMSVGGVGTAVLMR